MKQHHLGCSGLYLDVTQLKGDGKVSSGLTTAQSAVMASPTKQPNARQDPTKTWSANAYTAFLQEQPHASQFSSSPE